MKAKELVKKIEEISECIMCGDEMIPSITPIPGVTFQTFKEFNTPGLGFICDSCGCMAFISAEEIGGGIEESEEVE